MTENTKPLKWHNFLIYFGLWAGAFVYLAVSVQFFSGSIYGAMRDKFYQAFPSLQWLNIAFSLAMIAVVAYQIYTRFQLAGFKRGAPKKLLSLHVIGAVMDLSYTLLFALAVGIPLTNPDFAETTLARMIGRLIGQAISFFINKVYYGKRSELFVN